MALQNILVFQIVKVFHCFVCSKIKRESIRLETSLASLTLDSDEDFINQCLHPCLISGYI